MRRKLTAMLLVVCMVCTFLPVSAMAASQQDCQGGEGCKHEAAIGNVHYDTLVEAFAAAQDNDTVKLLKEVTVTSPIHVSGTLTLDLNGHKVLHKTDYDFPFYVLAGAFLTVDGTKPGSGMEIPEGDGKYEGFISVCPDASLILNGGSYIGNTWYSSLISAEISKDSLELPQQTARALSQAPATTNAKIELNNVTAKTNNAVVELSNMENMEFAVNGGTFEGGESYASVFSLITSTSAAPYTFTNVNAQSAVGSIVDCAGVKAIFNDCQFKLINDLDSRAIQSRMGAEATINSGSYVSSGYGVGVYGGTVNIKGGLVSGGDHAVMVNPHWREDSIVNISGGLFNGDVKIMQISNRAQVQPSTEINVTGGDFTHDPSLYVDLAKYDVVPSAVSGYQFALAAKGDAIAKPAVGGTNVDKSQLDAGMSDAHKQAVTKAAASVKADAAVLTAAANKEKATVTADEKASAEKALVDANLAGAEDTKHVYVQTYLEVTPKSYDGKTLTLDVQPMKRVVASTADQASNIVVKDEEGADQTANAVVLAGSEKELNSIQTMSFSVTLPTGFVTDEKEIFVQHNGKEFKTAITDGAGGEKVVTVTTQNGCGAFTYSMQSQAVAKIGDASYTTFQAAVDAVKDGETITLVKDAGTATVNKAVSFTVSAGNKTYELAPANGFELQKGENGKYTFTKTPVAPSVPSVTTYDITVDPAQNGKVTLSHSFAAQGATVTITPTPDKGYVVDMIAIEDAKGNPVVAKKNADGTYTFTMPASKVTVTAVFMEGPLNKLPFVDVAENDWFYPAVEYAYLHGLMNGVAQDTFAPNVTLSRAMMAQVLYNMEGTPQAGKGQFTDVKDGDWYANAVNWAAKEGIVAGMGDGTFAPNDNLTREQMAAILYRFAKYSGFDMSAKGDLAGFADANKVSPWAQESMSWAVGAGIISGMGDNTLAPQGTATRAQVATVLLNFCANMNK